MMKRLKYFAWFCFVLLACASFTINESIIGKEIPDFELKNIDGTLFSTKENKNAKGFIVVFTCNHCPMAKLYSQRLNDLHVKYASQGLEVVAINSMDTAVYAEESFEGMQQQSKAEGFTFPYLQDAGQEVGLLFEAPHTPHAYIIWKESGQWIVKYSGAIDNNGQHPKKATSFLKNAADDLLSGKSVSTPTTQSFGCRIYYRGI